MRCVAADFVVLVPLIMLNLLIALMGGSYERVEGQAKNEGRRQRAELLVDFEMLLSPAERKNITMFPEWLVSQLHYARIRTPMHSVALASQLITEPNVITHELALKPVWVNLGRLFMYLPPDHSTPADADENGVINGVKRVIEKEIAELTEKMDAQCAQIAELTARLDRQSSN